MFRRQRVLIALGLTRPAYGGGKISLPTHARAPRGRRWPWRAAIVGASLSAPILSSSCGSDGRPPLPGDPNGSANAGGAAANGGRAGAAGVAGSSGAGGGAMAGGAGTAGAGGTSGVVPVCIARQGCQRLCASLGDDPSACGVGNAEQCRCICEERFNGPCPEELDALIDCVGDAPSIDCSVRGRIFPGCEVESIALEICDFQAREQLCAQSFPLCTPYCQAYTLSFCPQGPESVTSCLCGCEATLATRCAVEFEAFMSCSSSTPEFSCDAGGRPLPTSCASEWQALDDCAGGVNSTPPDAGG